MRKIVIERPGGYQQLKVKECPIPTPRKDEVLIEVSAAGINFADVFVRLGLYKSGKEFVGWPISNCVYFPAHVVPGMVRSGTRIHRKVERTVFNNSIFSG